MVRLDAALSMGTWKFVSDASGTLKDEGNNVLGEYSYALKDLFVGDMPQTSYALGVTVTPIPGLRIQALFNMYDKNYSDWSPDGRAVMDWGDDGEPQEDINDDGDFDDDYDTAPDNGEGDGVLSETEWGYADQAQVWSAPAYSKIDLHVNYDLPVSLGNTRMSAFLHVFNALDAVYVQDAVDNSEYNSWGGTPHDADNAEVFLGIPRYFNLGLKVHF